jgi:hypothetical protein
MTQTEVDPVVLKYMTHQERCPPLRLVMSQASRAALQLSGQAFMLLIA